MPSKRLKENQASKEWSPGDFAWFIPNGEKRPQQGEIVKIYREIEKPCATLIMIIDSKYRTALISSLGETAEIAKKIASS